MLFRGDFHIHSCLSPCASQEMTPAAIIQQAKNVGLNAIALTDHNCAFNLPALDKLCKNAQMNCIYGLEVTSEEEAHILCYFKNLKNALKFGEVIYDSLPNLDLTKRHYNDQMIMDAEGSITGNVAKYLINPCAFNIITLLDMVHALNGLVVPAHIDRQVYGIITKLGYLPDEDFDAIELSPRGDALLAKYFPILRNSDAHQLSQIGESYTEFEAESFSLPTIREAWWNKHKR